MDGVIGSLIERLGIKFGIIADMRGGLGNEFAP